MPKLEDYLERLSVAESILLQSFRRMPAEKQEAVMYLAQHIAQLEIEKNRPAPNVVILASRKLG